MKNPWYARLPAFVQRVFFWLHIFKKDAGIERVNTSPEHDLLLQVMSPRTVPSFRQLRYSGRILAAWEKRFLAMMAVRALASGGFASYLFVRERTVQTPAVGGTYIE